MPLSPRPSEPIVQALGSHILSPRILALLRKALLLWHFGVFIAAVVEGVLSDNPAFMWFTLTHLSNTLLLMYYAVTVCLSHLYRSGAREPDATEGKARWLEVLALVLYTFNASVHYVVSLVYWLLYSDEFQRAQPFSQFVSGAQHGANTISVVISFFVCRWLPTVGTSVVHLGLIVLYVFWMWFYYALTGDWVYYFLAFDAGPVAQVVGTYLGLAVGFAVLAVAVIGAHRGRDWVAAKARMIGKERGAGPPLREQ